MNVVRYNPNRRAAIRRDSRSAGVFDDFFDDLFTPFLPVSQPAGVSDSITLKVDIYEKEELVIIEAELPGVEKEDISLDVRGKLITLGGERKRDEEIKEENSYRRERKFGKFERTFSLPFEVSSENVNANFKNGILKLEISKPEEQKPKQITIN